MSLGQKLVYLLKPIAATKIGDAIRNYAKTAVGTAYDLFFSEYRTEGCVFNIPLAHTTRKMRAKFLFDTYELSERRLINKYIFPGACVLELGASLGIVSCVINRRLEDRNRHVAVEVNRDLIPFIEMNRMQNGCMFVIEHGAVTTSHTIFFQATSESDSGQTSKHGSLPVPTRDLLEIETLYKLSFDTIVMDIEGAEIGFLAEYEAILPRIKTIIVEFHPDITGEKDIEAARGRLIRANLQSIDKILNVEVYSRVE